MFKNLRPALLFSFLICAGLMLTGILARPIFPVDETRYLTVAWEMHQSGNWILPTLNGEPYHHKPPVLFWIINLLWAVFGVSQNVAQVAPFLAGFAVLGLSARLSSRLFPMQKNAPLYTAVMLGGILPFVLYTNLIMFDLLLTVAVLIGVTALWDFFKTYHMRYIFVFALAIGSGLLIKGPAVLLHIAPVLLGVRYWMGALPSPVKKWLPHILCGLVLGIGLALCWALPAAHEGGSEFTQKIFYGQTTGRVVNAFDHKHALYWYLPFVPLFVVPWIFSSALWRGMAVYLRDKDPAAQENKRLLFMWLGVVFVAFSLISGKQVHYLLPLMPPVALLLTAAFLAAPDRLRKRDVVPILLGVILLALVPVLLHIFAESLAALAPHSVHLEDAFTALPIVPSLLIAVVISAAGIVALKHGKTTALVTVSVAMMLLTGAVQLAAKNSVYPHYDLENFGEELQKYAGRPLAFAGTYHGEFGFLGRLRQPLVVIEPNQMPVWYKEHPDGLVVLYTRKPDDFKGYMTVASMPYRMTNYFLLLAPKNPVTSNGGNLTLRPHDGL